MSSESSNRAKRPPGAAEDAGASLLPAVSDAKPAERIARLLPQYYRLVRAQDGSPYVVILDGKNSVAHRVGSAQLNFFLREHLHRTGASAKKADIAELNDALTAFADLYGERASVFNRIAPYQGGVEIALYDDADTRVRITAGRVEVVTSGSSTTFFRPASSSPMVAPAERGDHDLLQRYANLHIVDFRLLLAWITYTLAHPKVAATKFVLLVLLGSQGCGKTFLAGLLMRLIDPNVIGVQRFPASTKDLAIATQASHLIAYDNLRAIHPSMADALCIVATNGAITSRRLYTDAEQSIVRLHAALILNGLHSFLDQPDLAQRSLPLRLLELTAERRKAEAELARQLEADLPIIQRGLFDLTAKILANVEGAEVTNSERMLDFVHWIAAYERADGVPSGVYQAAYSDALNQGQRDGLQDSLLGATLLEFAEGLTADWHGTPTELLEELNGRLSREAQKSRDWPRNAIALSLRLGPLVPALATQGVHVVPGRRKERIVTISYEGDNT